MPEGIDIEGAATLVVAWRASGRRVEGRMVQAGQEVTEALRGFASHAAELIASASGQGYDPDNVQDDAAYLEIPQDELIDTPLLDTLRRGASLPSAAADDLGGSHPLSCYALLLGDDPDGRTIFVRHKNPVHLATKSLVARWFGDGEVLDRIDDPIFAFDDRFDVVVTPRLLLALDQDRFEMLFKDTEAVLAKAGEWVDRLSELLPISEDSRQEFVQRLRTSSVLRRKMHALLRKPHLESLTTQTLKEVMGKHGLDASTLMPNGELVIDKANERDVLRLLNEDFFSGDFSGEQYAATRKARRR